MSANPLPDRRESQPFCTECLNGQANPPMRRPIERRLDAWWCPVHKDRGTVTFLPAAPAAPADDVARLRELTESVEGHNARIHARCDSCGRGDRDFNKAAKGFQDERNAAIAERDRLQARVVELEAELEVRDGHA